MGKVALFILLFILVAVGLSVLNMADRGIPVAAILAAAPPSSVNPGPAAARATQLAGQSAAAATEAANILQQQQEVQRAWDAEYARQTQVVAERTAEVERLYTATAVQATLEAARAESTQVAGVTATAQYWANAQQAQTATVDAIKAAAMAVEATQIVNDQVRRNERENLKLQTASATAWFWANWQLWLFLVFCSILFGVGFAGFKYLAIQQSTAVGIIPMDEHGNSYSAVVGGKIHNSNLMTAPTLDPRQVTIPVTAESALEVAKLNQARNSIWGLGKNGYRKDAYQATQQLTQAVGQELQPPAEDPTDPAPWDLAGWGGKALPLGLTFDNQAIEWEPAKTPNLIVAGTSGGGKSQMFTRPLIAEALASRSLVYAMSEKMVDFAVFGKHPNLYRVRGKAQGLLDLLEAAGKEVDRRVETMEKLGAGTAYDFIPDAINAIGPRIMIVVDGLVNFIFSEPDSGIRRQIWAQAISVASLCRATGLMLVFGTTDPSHRLGDNWLAIRENCGRVATRLMEEDASRIVLQMTGAEKLRGSQFIARLDGDPVRGVAFWPKDQEIANFLASRPVPKLPAPAFIGAQQAPLTEAQPEVITREQRILDLYKQGRSLNDIQMEIFGRVGGAAFYAVKAVIGSTTGNTTTGTAQNGPAAAD